MRITSKGQVTIPVAIRKKATTIREHGHRLVEAMRGRATTGMSTDQIMALTRR